MNTEITDVEKGKVFYDDGCGMCVGLAVRFGPTLRAHGFRLSALQNGPIAEEMQLTLADGRTFGGADAVVQIAKRVWWAWPLFLLAQVPGAIVVMRAVYRWIAARRHCLSGACRVPASGRRTASTFATILDWAPLVLLPLAALLIRGAVRAWVFMWAVAGAVYFGCKWITWRRARRTADSTSLLRSLAYFFAWPGMDAPDFFRDDARSVPKPRIEAWVLAAFKIAVGALFVVLAGRNASGASPAAAAWLGMIGLAFLMHFGLFELAALAWQRAGVQAGLVMNRPLAATSLSDFWNRWNTAFSNPAYDLAFRPLMRRFGAAGALMAVFVISGLVHELVISLPAGGGYGLPTAYFVLQGCGVLFEHSRLGRRLGLGHGPRGRLFLVLVAAGPAYWLFHPPFVHNVILPMLRCIGAV